MTNSIRYHFPFFNRCLQPAFPIAFPTIADRIFRPYPDYVPDRFPDCVLYRFPDYVPYRFSTIFPMRPYPDYVPDRFPDCVLCRFPDYVPYRFYRFSTIFPTISRVCSLPISRLCTGSISRPVPDPFHDPVLARPAKKSWTPVSSRQPNGFPPSRAIPIPR